MSGKLHRDGLSAAFWYLIVFPFKRLCHGAWNLQSYSGLRNSRMLRFVYFMLAAAMLLAGLARAEAGVVVTVDKTAQRLTVAVDGVTRFNWPVSTARWGYRTPNGVYRPQRLARKWYSRKYHWSPMPYSIFFDGGYAIHGSYEVSRLGRPASHGCIRLHPKHAAVLFALVSRNRGDTEIVVTGSGPAYVGRSVKRAQASRSRSYQTYRGPYRTYEAYPQRRTFDNVFTSPTGTVYYDRRIYRGW
jgi:hypothetical protein